MRVARQRCAFTTGPDQHRARRLARLLRGARRLSPKNFSRSSALNFRYGVRVEHYFAPQRNPIPSIRFTCGVFFTVLPRTGENGLQTASASLPNAPQASPAHTATRTRAVRHDGIWYQLVCSFEPSIRCLP